MGEPLYTPVVVCLACGHAHRAKVWQSSKSPNGRYPGVCAGCYEAAAHRRGGCDGRGCMCVDGDPSRALFNDGGDTVGQMVNPRAVFQGASPTIGEGFPIWLNYAYAGVNYSLHIDSLAEARQLWYSLGEALQAADQAKVESSGE